MFADPRAVFDKWPTLESASADFKSAGHDISASAISKWAQRGRIPPEYWLPLVEVARRRDISGVTFEALALMHARAALDRGEIAEARA